MAVVHRYRDLIPRLQAEESLLAVERVGMGTGSFEAKDAKAIGASWDRDRHPHRDAAPRSTRTPESLKAAGFVVFGPKRQP